MRWSRDAGGFGRSGWLGLRVFLGAVAVCAATASLGAADVAASRPATGDTWRQREREGFLQALAAREAQKMPQKSSEELVVLLKDPDPEKRAMAAMRIGQIEAPPFAVWEALAGCLEDTHWRVRVAAMQSLGSVGGGLIAANSALPLLRDKEALVRCAAVEAIGKLADGRYAVFALVPALGDEDTEVRSMAARTLGSKGKAAASAAGMLAELVNTDPAWGVRESAAGALRELGVVDDPVSLALTQALLSDSSQAVRLAAAKSIVILDIPRSLWAEELVKRRTWDDVASLVFVVEALGGGEPTEANTKATIGYLGHKSPLVRSAAARAVGKIGPPAGAAARRLAEMARNGWCPEQADAIGALGRLGPAARDTVGMLATMLIDRVKACQEVVRVLGRHVPGLRSESYDARRRLANPDLGAEFDRAWALACPPAGEQAAVGLRMRLVEAIVALDPNAGAGSLIAAVGDPNAWVADLAEKGLAKCTIVDAGTLTTAVEAMGSLPGERKKPVRELLARSGRPAAEAVVRRVLAGGDPVRLVRLAESIDPNAMAPVVAVLNGGDLLAALDAAHSLSYSRRFGKQAAGILAEQLSTGGPAAREQARRDLVRLGPRAVDALLILSRGPDATVRTLAMHTLGRIGPAGGKDAEDGLIHGLKDRDSGVRRAAAVALVAVSENPAPATPVLAEDLKSPVPQLRLEAAEALGRIGPAADAEVARALAQCLRDEHWAVRLCAARALERIATSTALPKAVAEALKAATKDSDADVRKAAEVALAAMEKARR